MKMRTSAVRIADRIPWCLLRHQAVPGYLWLLALGAIAPAQAGDVAFKGELIKAPNCTISNNEVIDVDFGQNIAIRKLDGVNYQQTVSYGLKCDVSDYPWVLSLKVAGPITPFNPAALQTSVDGLGIEVRQNGEPLIIGKKLLIDPKKPPTLQAVPVKKPGVELVATDFSVTATLTAEYQ